MDSINLKHCLNNALNYLVETQSICFDCSLKVEAQRKQWSEWQIKIGKIVFLQDCIIKQSGFLYENVLHKRIEDSLLGEEWSNSSLDQLRDEMNLWQGRIDDKMKELENTENVLVNLKDKDNKITLANYITDENMTLLRHKIDEIPSIKKHINNIHIQYDELNSKIKNKLINNRIKELNSIIGKELNIDSNKDIISLFNIYPRQLNDLENDLETILLSLVNHFDRCKLLNEICQRKSDHNSNSVSNKPENNNDNLSSTHDCLSKNDCINLYKIVEKDNEELPSILKTVKEIIKDINVTLEKSTKILNEKETIVELIKIKINKILMSLKKYNEYLLVFQDISNLITNFKETCKQDIKIIQQLYRFYEKYQKSYHNLLNEVDRRRKLVTKMERILKECEQNLKVLQIEDLSKRKQFLEDNGNFLPGNIWPDEIDNFESLYKMEYSIKKV